MRQIQIPFKLYDKMRSTICTIQHAIENPTQFLDAEFDDDGTPNPVTRVVHFTNKDLQEMKQITKMIEDQTC